MALVETIKQLCLKTGDTFASLEKKLHFGNATIRKWDKAMPSGDRLLKVAEYFGVSVDYLLGDNKSTQTKPATSRLRSVARLEDNSISPEQDEEISHFIDYLLHNKDKQ